MDDATTTAFESYFRLTSYLMVACGVLSLVVSGGMSTGLAAGAAITYIVAWRLESTPRWQLSERAGLVTVLLSLPIFYLDWKFQATAGLFGKEQDRIGISALTHFILLLSIIKLFQIKSDRDWLFLYLISFFEVLLAAGLSISPRFLAALCLYMFFALATIVCFEIRKARRAIPAGIRTTRIDEPPKKSRSAVKFFHLKAAQRSYKPANQAGKQTRSMWEVRRVSTLAFCLLLLILTLALPIFLVAPRFGGGGLLRSGHSAANYIGFTDKISLGVQGRLQQTDNVVMRVRLDGAREEDGGGGGSEAALDSSFMRWRGASLDYFDGRNWSRSDTTKIAITGRESGLFPIDTTESLDRLTTQTFYLEPTGDSVLFAAPRPVALQGEFFKLQRDQEGNLSTSKIILDRISYRAYSDTRDPDVKALRADRLSYSPRDVARYLSLPSELDPRIKALAQTMVEETIKGPTNGYDIARVIESRIRNDFRYSLEMQASGSDPLADFLFNIREGHCEYFATAMAVMLRTQGIAARVVNGFQRGEYNDAADVYTVRQKHAHSWVEAYFPATDAWVTFDPTPFSIQTSTANASYGLSRVFNKYAEALEMLWIQYVVAYDRQEQRQLATSFKNQISARSRTMVYGADSLIESLKIWWRDRREQFNNWYERDASRMRRWWGLGLLLSLLLTLLFIFEKRVGVLSRLLNAFNRLRRRTESSNSVVLFYERMLKALAARGLKRAADQTPLEFAEASGIPEALMLTRMYNRVRYGALDLLPREAQEVEEWLHRIETEAHVQKHQQQQS